MARDLGTADGQWSIDDWLQSLDGGNAEKPVTVLGVRRRAASVQPPPAQPPRATPLPLPSQVIADALQASKPSDVSAFEYVKSLDDVEGILMSSDLPNRLAAVVGRGVERLREQKAASAHQLSDKFKNEDGAFSFSFGGLSTFFGGLEGLVGTPTPPLLDNMQRDHIDQMDSYEWFAVKNQVWKARDVTTAHA